MKLTNSQIEVIVEKVIGDLKKQNVITFKADEKKVYQRAVQAVKDNIEEEQTLDRDVSGMLDELERSNPGQFQRHKMFTLLKVKLAKERKFIL
jgi:hypothetical protein